MVMVGVYIKKLIEDGALREDFTIELLGIYPLNECLEREKELAKASLFPKGLNGNAGKAVVYTDEVREKMSKKTKENNQEKIKNKTHNFQNKEWSKKHNKKIAKKRVLEGTHHLLGKGLMSVFDKEEGRCKRVHKDLYNQNRSRYLTLSSKEYRRIKEKSNGPLK